MTAISEHAILPGWGMTEGVLTLPCPDALTDRARAWLADAHAVPVVPRPAATVILVRPGRRGPDAEVFMLRRSAGMAFAAGAVVFPGGRVDARDYDDVGWIGPDPEEWARRLGCPVPEAKALVVAAVRELFEESGVLLAGTGPDHVVAHAEVPELAREVDRLATHELSLAEVLARHDLMLRSDLLGLRGRWLTPEFEPRRYDTYFFAALLPEGQETDSNTSEADADAWTTPRSVLRAAAAGEVALFPPTAHSIVQLAGHPSAGSFVREQPVVERIMLEPLQTDDGFVLSGQLPRSSGIKAERAPTLQKEVRP